MIYSRVKEFLIWMRNGIAFTYTWLILLFLIYTNAINQEMISIEFLTKTLLFDIVGVATFTFIFSRTVIHRLSMRIKIILFFVAFAIEEVGYFRWVEFWNEQGSEQQWIVFTVILLVLLSICLIINKYIYSENDKVYSDALERYKKTISTDAMNDNK